MYVLDLDETIRAAGAAQQEVDPAALVVADLAPNQLVAPKLGDPPGSDRFLDQTIGMYGVDPDQTAVGPDQLEGERQRAVWVACPRYPDACAWLVEPQHPARIGAMHGDLTPIFKNDVGKESLVPAHQAPGDQRRRPAHDATSKRFGRKCHARLLPCTRNSPVP
jgi:hypothetical protein